MNVDCSFIARILTASILSLGAGCGDQGVSPPAAVEIEPSPVVPVEQAEIDFNAMLAQLADDHARQVLAEAPEFATILGVSEDVAGAGFAARLGGYGFEANQRVHSLNEKFIQDIRSLERSELDGPARITYDTLRHSYETAARRNQFDFGAAAPFASSSPYMVTQLTGPHLFLPRLMLTQHPVESETDAQSYLARLEAFGRVFDEVNETVGADAAIGVVPPDFAIAGARQSIASFTNMAAAENPLARNFATKILEIDGLSEDAKTALSERATELVEMVVFPAYARLDATLESIMAQATSDAGIWKLGEEGAAFYQHALDSYGAAGMTGEEIHTLGLAEVERISAQMDAIMRADGQRDGSVAARFSAIGLREGMQYPNTDEGRAVLLGDLNEQVAEIMAEAPDWFGAVPSQPVEVRRIPVYEQDSAPGGYYSSPALTGDRPGIFWINLKDTADWPKHTLKTLTYHEAAPGHHFQRSLERSAGLPLIRNMLGFSEFAEGWALYAEQVAAEMGLYDDDPLGDLGRLQSELFRAARLVVDTGIHHHQWSREDAISYMQSVTGDGRAAVTREIERYAVWPGQACSYKIGMLKINELRERAEAALGDRFDLKDFHDEVLLTGAMPLPVLERKIDAWIERQ